MECKNKERKIFLPIDILYDPVKHIKIKINCYFSTQKMLTMHQLLVKMIH